MNKQKGYIKIVLVVFAVVIGLMIFPLKFPPEKDPVFQTCLAGRAPLEDQIIRLPVPTFIQTKYYEKTEENISWGPPDYNKVEEYVLIRTDVLTPLDATTPGWTIFGTNPLSGLAHSIPIGEDPQKPGYILYHPTSAGEILFSGRGVHLANEELVLFRNEDPTSVRSVNGKTYFSVDVYQKKTRFDTVKDYQTAELFSCTEEISQVDMGPRVTVPGQDVSQTRDQLQLEWFLLQQGGGLWGVHCKPAVYLYPQRKQLVNVQVHPKGQLSYTEPLYDPVKGWTVSAGPDGKIEMPNAKYPMSNSQYPYLYYESKILDQYIEKPTKGWVVESGGLEKLYNEVLPKLGLNKKEQADFINYWSEKLPDSPYYFVGLMEKEQRDYLEPLTVTPNPETSIRFSLYFEPLNNPVAVEEPEINTPIRSGFTLVDWGGMIKLHKDTSFTCSQ